MDDGVGHVVDGSAFLGRVVGAAEEDVLLVVDGDLHARRRRRGANFVVVHDEQIQLTQELPVAQERGLN